MTANDLRTRLEAAGVSQMELARRLKVDGRTVRYWLSEDRVPDKLVGEIGQALVLKVCEACGRPL